MILIGRINNLGLRVKFILAFSLFIIAGGSLVSYYLIASHIDTAEKGLMAKGDALIKILAANCEYGTIIENETILGELIGATAQTDDLIYIVVQNLEGKTLAYKARNNFTIPRHNHQSEKSDSLYTKRIYYPDGGNYYYELCYPVVTTHGIVSREMLGEVGRGHGHMVTETIGKVRMGISVSATIAAAKRNVGGAVIIILLVIIVTILLTFGFVNMVTKPLAQLASAADKIAQGDLSLTTGIKRYDEIGQLAAAFDSMVASLKESRRAVEDYNRTLEEKIIERTQALENTQSQLIQSEKMAAVGQLSAGVAHELNNPLGGILGYAQYTLEKMSRQPFDKITEKDFESYQRHLRDIEAQTRRCKMIVQNLLKFSRSSSKIEKTTVSINAVLMEIFSLIEHQLSMHKINLVTDLHEGVPSLQANAGMLQQVFTNIIINAIHAMPEGGNLLIASRYSAGLGEFSGAVEVSFSDSGCGIPADIQKNIFEPFFTTKAVGQGTGLGLSVSYGIVKDHGGEIKVDSIEGCGATFTIILPLEGPGTESGGQTGFREETIGKASLL